MTAPSSTVKGVHTSDATPDAPSYRLSGVAGHDTALATITVAPGDAPGAYVGAIKLTLGAARNVGEVANLGAVCGACRCGAPGVKPLRITDATKDVTFAVRRSQIAGADRDVTVNVWTLALPTGWV